MAFWGCGNLKTLEFGAETRNIGPDAFDGTNVKTVNYRGTQEDRNQITFSPFDDTKDILFAATWHYEYGQE